MIRPVWKSILCALSVACLVSAKTKEAPDWHWYYYTLDSSGTGEGYSKLRYDADGTLKVLYRAKGNIYYAELGEKAWKVSFADSSVKYEGKIAMDLDADGNPHILHQDDMYSKVIYDYYDGEEWLRKKVDTLTLHGPDFYNLDLVVDSKSTSHLFYTTNKDTYNTATYNTVDIDGKAGTPEFASEMGGAKWNSIVLDENERPVLAYFVYDQDGALFVSYREDGKWAQHAVFSSRELHAKPLEGYYACMKRDTNGDYYILSHSRINKKVQMAVGKPQDTVWKAGIVDTLRGSTQFSTRTPFELGRNGMIFVANPHVIAESEYIPASSKLYMAYKSKSDSVWRHEPVDTVGFVGTHADMTLTPEGLPAISYFDYARKRTLLAIARTQAPTDTNGNGIPDYQESPIPITKIRARYRTVSIPAGQYLYYDVFGRKLSTRSGSGQGIRVAVPKQGRSLLLNPAASAVR